MKDWLACDVCRGSGIEEVYGGHGTVLEFECTKTPMTIEEAVASILGKGATEAIIRDQGIRWAVVGAMAAAGPGTKNDPRAIITIRQWNADRKAELETRP